MDLQALKTLYNSLFHLRNSMLNGRTTPREFALADKLIQAQIQRVKTATPLKPFDTVAHLATCSAKYQRMSNEGSSPMGREKFVREVSEETIRGLEKKWGDLPKVTYVPIAPIEDMDLCNGQVEVIVPPGHTKCSFCGIIVDDIRVTKAKAHPRKIFKEEMIGDELVERVIHLSDDAAACPDCSLTIFTHTFTFKNKDGVVEERMSFTPNLPRGD